MYAIELYVPKYNNAGESIRPEDWLSLEKQITDAFGGFTRYAGVGSFKGQEEAVTVYRILHTRVRTGPISKEREAIRGIAMFVKVRWQQISVLYTVQKLETVEYV